MIGRPQADSVVVNDPLPTSALLDEILAALPDPANVAHRGGQRLVTSPGGVFVLDPGPGDVIETAQRAALAANRTRELLATHLSWVPFVDWFVVSAELGPDEHDVLPLDLVTATVLEGHAVGDEVAASICNLVVRGLLTPDWHAGLPVVPA